MKKLLFPGTAIAIELLAIAAIAAACAFSGLLFYFFYNVIYGLLLSVLVPLVYVWRKKESVASLGIAPLRAKQIIIVFVFVFLSIGGQSIPLAIEGTKLQWNHLLIGFIPLVMTTFFEEMLFRGFLQTRLEKFFGVIPAVILSGLCFSLYHLGYPGFRTITDLAVLFAVGVGFALAYKLSGNNLAAAYLVNLPNALLTYMLKYEQFPNFDVYSVGFALVSIIAICVIMFLGLKRIRSNELNRTK